MSCSTAPSSPSITPSPPQWPSRSRLVVARQVEALGQAAAQQVAALIADTVTAVYASAAYLVLGSSWGRSLWLASMRVAEGTVLHLFDGFPPKRLPALSAGHPLLAEWGEVDAFDPCQLQHALKQLLDGGMVREVLPGDLPCEAGVDPERDGEVGLAGADGPSRITFSRACRKSSCPRCSTDPST
ncbi:hypothetical protein ABIA33_004939 [Streptacidiphilus sp. MAP12-16]|uniref:hypothetical protein n=1 Tax=Streptacidiphilus sp. MAP12-16 TaxID=3156300 RepID=UPI003515AA92